MNDNVVPFELKEALAVPEELVEVYGCECGNLNFTLLLNGLVQCPACESVVPLVIMSYPTFVRDLIINDSEETLAELDEDE